MASVYRLLLHSSRHLAKDTQHQEFFKTFFRNLIRTNQHIQAPVVILLAQQFNQFCLDLAGKRKVDLKGIQTDHYSSLAFHIKSPGRVIDLARLRIDESVERRAAWTVLRCLELNYLFNSSLLFPKSNLKAMESTLSQSKIVRCSTTDKALLLKIGFLLRRNQAKASSARKR